MKTVVVVGASLGGLRSAQALRRQGFEGRLILVGEESERPYDRPPLSKEVLAGKWDAERTPLIRSDDDEPEGVDWELGRRATALDADARRVRLDDGRELGFDGLVIATGARPRTLPGLEGRPGVHVLRTLEDCLALRSALDASPRVAVIGAGFIGAEVAATCRGRGLDVAMVEALPVPLERALGATMGELVAQVHRDHGVELRTGVGVSEVLGGARVEGLRLADGSEVPAEVVVVGIGVAPNTDWLLGSGVEVGNGVVCDARCRTSVPGIVAVGDVAEWHNPLFDERMRLEHWTNATEQADAATAVLLHGDEAPAYAPVPFFWSDQYDRKIQFGGRAHPDDETVVVDGSIEERRFVMLYGRGNRLRGVLGWNRPRLVMKYRGMIREGVPFSEARSPA